MTMPKKNPTYKELEQRVNKLEHVESALKTAEKALRESEAKYKSIINNIEDGYYEVDLAGSFIFFNDSMCKILGYPKNELVGMNNMQYMDKENAKKVFRAFNRVYRTGESYKAFDWELIKKDSSKCYVETSVALMRDTSGQPIGFQGIARDITERKQAEKALRESEETLRGIISSVRDGMITVLDLEGRHLFVSGDPDLDKRYGIKFGDLVGLSLYDIFPPEEVREKIADLQEIVETREPKRKDIRVNMPNGEFWHDVSISPIYDSSGEVTSFAVFVLDITARKRTEKERMELEKKLARSQKMESIGLLSGGVAHDLNNVLSGIVSYPELILMDLPLNSKLRKPLETIQECGNKAAGLAQDLLTVAKGVAIQKEPLNLNSVVGDYLNSLEFKDLKHLHPKVTVKITPDLELLNINGSYDHIRKAVMNLVLNASESIEVSGNIKISTHNRYLDRPLRGYDDVNIGEFAVISISDDGPGVSSEDLERIFEPFYTKKIMGRSGTGLGLTVVWNVVQDHEGYINVKTDKSGTTFELYFPIIREEISVRDSSISINDYKGSKELILVVDDEESQREISCRMLETLGYQTKSVPSGEECIEYLKKNSVDLILLDMIMDPGMNGRETYERIIKIHPYQKAVIVSGFAETDEVKKAQKLGAGRYIKKPLTLKTIGLAVQEELRK
jgi:PAS domain S-box-containing protein